MRHVLSRNLTVPHGIISISGALLMAIATGISAYARFYMPWSPVPVTMQTFAVLLSGMLLGSSMGALSQIIYIVLGSSMLSLFSVYTPGIPAIMGPTGGYLIGFIMAAFLAGRIAKQKHIIRQFLLLSAVNFICIYIPGLMQLSLFTGIYSPNILLNMGLLPFIAGDLMKICLAIIIYNMIRKINH